jgi:hypothetical protein
MHASLGPTTEVSAIDERCRTTDPNELRTCRNTARHFRGVRDVLGTCDEDLAGICMLIAGWRVRIERCCSPLAMQLGRAGHQVEEASQGTLRMGSSLSWPRWRTSRRPEDASAPSASRYFTTLYFGVAHCGVRRQTAAVSASGPGKQLDSPEESDTELCMSWVSGANTGVRPSTRNVLLGNTSRPPTASPPKLSTHEPKANQGGVLLRA